ncbi:MAG: DUF99 family protein [Candidatus Marsarchaeota archaeon]|nr:DUF99 family protein [Candidatus Marsarchaeota archaeon]
MKKGVRILAIACAPLKDGDTLLVGVVSRADMIEGILSTRVKVDGTDSTEKISRMLNKSRFREQVRLIAMNGIGIAGLNIVDVKSLERRTDAKVLSVTRRRPHPRKLIDALKAFADMERESVSARMEMINQVKKLNEFRTVGFYAQTTLERNDAEKFVTESVKLVRLAHLIASGVTSGESKGRI